MEYVDGADLGAIVRGTSTLEINDAIRCIVQAGKGISYAHQNGVIHRDIKPSNMFVGHGGVVKVLDMGLARWSVAAHDKTASDLSSSGMIMGTIDYLAPEQAADSKSADERCDLYSLGCSLFYINRGAVIHPRDSMIEKLLAHREADPPNLVDQDDDPSRELNAIFHKMIARRPADRYESVETACTALQQWSGVSDDDLKLTITIPKPQIANPRTSTLAEDKAQNIDTTRLTASPQLKPRSRNPWWIAAAFLGVMLIGLLSVPTIIRLWTPDGTLIVKCYVEGASVEIDGKRHLTITDPSSKSTYGFELRPGKHLVRITLPNGTEIRSDSVTITSKKGTLFEVSKEDVDKSTGVAGTTKGNAKKDADPNVHTVAQDGTAEYSTIQSALRDCHPNDTILVLDDGDYAECAIMASPKHEGVTIDFRGKARWLPRPYAKMAPMCLLVTQPNITIRGAYFLLKTHGYGALVVENASNLTIEQCKFESSPMMSVGISVEAFILRPDRMPVIVKESQFVGLNNAIRLSGSSNDNLRPAPIGSVLIHGNNFVECNMATIVAGEAHDIMFAGNIISGSTLAGFQCQNLLPKSKNILVTNNSFLMCHSPVRVWENGVTSVMAQFVNNLTLNSNPLDWEVHDSGGSPIERKGPGNGQAFSDHWMLHDNYREGEQQTDISWMPPSDLDHLLLEIEVLSRDPKHADYLRPVPDSPIATAGAGGEFPSYVGAVPPSGTPQFDWEKYFTSAFMPDAKSKE